MPSRAQRVKALRELYKQVPRIECKGLCTDSCGPLDPPQLEVEQMEARSGRPFTSRATGAEVRAGIRAGTHTGRERCCYLSKVGRCTVYGDRPMICRVWGVVDSMPCHHGCKPVGGRYLSDPEAYRLLSLAFEMPEHQVRTVVERVASGDLDEYLAALKPKTVIEARANPRLRSGDSTGRNEGGAKC